MTRDPKGLTPERTARLNGRLERLEHRLARNGELIDRLKQALMKDRAPTS